MPKMIGWSSWEAMMIGHVNALPRVVRRTALGAVVAAFAGLVAGAVSAAAVEPGPDLRFLPHRVLYTMELDHAEQGASVSSASGHMYYRFEPLCDGWEVETRVFMRLHYGLGEAAEVVETTWSFGSFESYDGRHFTFGVDHNRDGEPLEVLDGEAMFDERETGQAMDNVMGKAHFIRPERDIVPLPAGTVFPAVHLSRLLAKAKAGERRYSQVVFDGASVNNPYEVNAFIIGRLPSTGGKPATVARRGPIPDIGPRHVQAVSAAEVLPESPAWRVRMAYFPLYGGGGLPEFEIQVDYREDGVAEHMIQDFGDFALDLTPRRFEALPYPDCR